MAGLALEKITPDWVRSVLPRRPAEANKGSFGKVLVVAGSASYIGAAYLAASGAMRVGAGLVRVAAPVSIVTVLAAKLAEATWLPLPESGFGLTSDDAPGILADEAPASDALVVGCGLGRSDSAARLVMSMLLTPAAVRPPTVIDADALNILSGVPEWWRRLTGNAILTPHPGEMARLSGMSVEEVQADRVGVAVKMADRWRSTVVLKGAHTVVASPGRSAKISPFANPGLASAGTGDVLSGVIAGFLAQGLTLADAASCGVYVHGEAGEIVKDKLGDAGMVASDLLPALPLAIHGLKVNQLRRPSGRT